MLGVGMASLRGRVVLGISGREEEEQAKKDGLKRWWVG